jgi:hypothetical protein
MVLFLTSSSVSFTSNSLTILLEGLLGEVEGLEVFASLAVALVDETEELLFVGV